MKTIQDALDEANEQQRSLVRDMLIGNQVLTANEMRGILGFESCEENALYEISEPQFSLVKTPVTNCPNCGAPRRGRSCEYCGTVFISDCNVEAEIEALQKRLGMLVAIKNAEQQWQMMQNIIPYRFNPMANTSQCCCSIQDSIQQQLNVLNPMANTSQCCCSTRDSIQRQYDSQYSAAAQFRILYNDNTTHNFIKKGEFL